MNFGLILAILGAVLAVMIVLVIIPMFVFKHKVRIREVIGNKKYIIDDKAREVNKDGITFWQLYKLKIKIPVPPSEAIELTKRGKKVIEVYKLPTGEYIFAKDVAEPIPQKIMDIKDSKEKETAIKDHIRNHESTIVSFEPLTTEQRIIWINQLKKAQDRRTKKWQEYIPVVASIGGLVVIIIALFIFWGDIAKPVLDAHGQNIRLQELRVEEMMIMKEIKQDIQVLKTEQTGKPSKAPD